MATAEGVDYSIARPDPAGLKAAGKAFAVRYLSPPPNRKNLTVAERDALLAAGVLPVLVWETAKDAALGGYTAGVRHATLAAEMAAQLGAPNDCVIYFAVDFNPTAAQLSTVGAYFHGVCSVLPFVRVGCYGGLRTISEARRLGWAKFLWQTYAWSGGVWHASATLRQHSNGVAVAGGDCDLNRAMTDYIGQWDAQGVRPGWEGDDMDANQDKKLDDIWQVSSGLAAAADRVPQHNHEGFADLTKLYERIAARAAELIAGGIATDPLTPAEADAIAQRVLDLVKADLATMVAALAPGKATPPDGGAASGG